MKKEMYKLNNNAYRQTKYIVKIKFRKLKLIALDKEKNPHKKKFYFLTDIGLFYIIKIAYFFTY